MFKVESKWFRSRVMHKWHHANDWAKVYDLKKKSVNSFLLCKQLFQNIGSSCILQTTLSFYTTTEVKGRLCLYINCTKLHNDFLLHRPDVYSSFYSLLQPPPQLPLRPAKCLEALYLSYLNPHFFVFKGSHRWLARKKV